MTGPGPLPRRLSTLCLSVALIALACGLARSWSLIEPPSPTSIYRQAVQSALSRSRQPPPRPIEETPIVLVPTLVAGYALARLAWRKIRTHTP